MRIGFDLRRIGNPGIGRYMKCLVEAVIQEGPEHEYVLLLPPGTESILQGGNANIRKIATTVKYYSIREQFVLPGLLRENGVEIFHSPHFLIPLIRPCPTVVTIHDLIYITCKEDLPSFAGRLYYKWMMEAAARLCRSIITDSEYSKTDIVRHLGVDPRQVAVIYPGIDPQFRPVRDEVKLAKVREKYGIKSDYVLYTGIYKPRKNHAALLRAFENFLQTGVAVQLVFAGPADGSEVGLRRLASEFGITDQVVFAGFVSDEDLPALYSSARIYACPSLYEGFGFTVLEAMTCGTPVVCTRETSLPEVAGQGALYADPRQRDEFALALHRAFTDEDLRRQLIASGFANVKRFSWQTAAKATLDVYGEAVQMRSL